MHNTNIWHYIDLQSAKMGFVTFFSGLFLLVLLTTPARSQPNPQPLFCTVGTASPFTVQGFNSQQDGTQLDVTILRAINDGGALTFQDVGSGVNVEYNALAYDPQTGFLYGMQITGTGTGGGNRGLVRIGHDGSGNVVVQPLGWPGFPTVADPFGGDGTDFPRYDAADIDPAARLYYFFTVSSSHGTTCVKTMFGGNPSICLDRVRAFDLDLLPPPGAAPADLTAAFQDSKVFTENPQPNPADEVPFSGSGGVIADWVFEDGKLYGGNIVNGNLAVITPLLGRATTDHRPIYQEFAFDPTGVVPMLGGRSAAGLANSYGAAWKIGGIFYFYRNGGQDFVEGPAVYKVDPQFDPVTGDPNPRVIEVISGPNVRRVERNDAASCSQSSPPGANTCPMNPSLASQCTQCVTNALNVATDCPGSCAGQPPLAAPCFDTLQGAVDSAVAGGGGLVCVFENTNENVTIGNNVDVRIEQCRHARITAANPLLPVITVAASAGDMNPANNGPVTSKDILINSLEVQGGSVGILVENNSTELKAIKARENGIGLQIDGNTNLVKNSGVDLNETGLAVNGDSNVFEKNKIRHNTQHGTTTTGQTNFFKNNTTETNGESGFFVQGADNEFRSNRSRLNATGFQLTPTASGNMLWQNKAEENTGFGLFVEGMNNEVGTRRGGNRVIRNGDTGILVAGTANRFEKNNTECNGGDGLNIAVLGAAGNTLSKNRSCKNVGDDFNVGSGNTGDGEDRLCGQKVSLPGIFDNPAKQCSQKSSSGSSLSGNRAPVASLRSELLSRNTGIADLIELDGSKSQDRDGTILQYCFSAEEKATGNVVLPETCVNHPKMAVTLGVGEFNAFLDVIDDQGLRSTKPARRSLKDN